MRINLPGVSSLALLLVLSSCELLEELEAPVSPELSEQGCQLPSYICATAEYAEHMPKYPGGHEKMMQFLAEHIEWPKEFDTGCIQGTVVVRFTVEQSGKLNSARIAKSLYPAFDAIGLQVVQKMPNWLPGTTKEGTPIAMEMNLPIRFRLE
ncbi:MAG: energy transducer TonB [Haliscomenobacter sp.]|uniref:energy transducer TonB n=1 Tax=Haliscomenobacter sp. TaxID=2717303 RepID=UPI0029B9EE1F|nr:energy transducer TonB [Haliscomenobacter sp.]MDX2069943.1 energy transducer TonB [Haliscomenobacter sp.]